MAALIMDIIGTTTLVRDDDGTGYAYFPDDNGVQTIAPINSQEFEGWLASQFYDTHNDVATSQALKSALQIACYQASKKPSIGEVALRFGHLNGNHYIDTCNQGREIIEITPQGWHINHGSPVVFRKSPTQRPILTPTKGGDLLRILDYLNIVHE